MKKALLWDFEKQNYKPILVDDEASAYSLDYNAIIKCASCGRYILYGDSFNSKQIHTENRLSYNICYACFIREHRAQVKKLKKRYRK